MQPDQNGIGPSLAGTAGRKAGSAPGFAFSPAFKSADFAWDKAKLVAFLTDPAAVVPGNRMLFPGYDTPSDADAVADYVLSLPD